GRDRNGLRVELGSDRLGLRLRYGLRGNDFICDGRNLSVQLQGRFGDGLGLRRRWEFRFFDLLSRRVAIGGFRPLAGLLLRECGLRRVRRLGRLRRTARHRLDRDGFGLWCDRGLRRGFRALRGRWLLQGWLLVLRVEAVFPELALVIQDELGPLFPARDVLRG